MNATTSFSFINFTKEGVLMGLTINWLLNHSTLKNLKLLTCQEFSNTEITGVNILDNPDSIQWIKPGELILTTGYIFINNPLLQENTIRGLKNAGCAALCIKTRRFFETIPCFMKDIAQEVGLILIELPLDYSLADISKEVTKNLYQQTFHEIAREQTLFNALFNSYFQGKSFRETLKILSDYLSHSVFVLENHQLGEWYALTEEDRKLLNHEHPQLIPLLETIKEINQYKVGSVIFESLTKTAAFLSFSNASYILCILCDKPENLPWSTISQALKILDFSRNSETIHRPLIDNYFDSLFRFLMLKEDVSETFTLQICEYYGISHSSDSICMLITSKDSAFDTQYTASSCRQMLEQNSFYADSFFIAWNPTIIYISFFPNNNSSFLEKLDNFIENIDLIPSITYSISRLDGNTLQKAFEEASFMLSLAKIFPEKHFFPFHEYLIFWEIAQLSPEEKESIYHTSVKPLVDFDKEHHCDLVQTLFIYYQCNFNASITAKKLFIHRNTFLNRINKIENILHFDTSNFNCLFSIYYGLCVYLLSTLF